MKSNGNILFAFVLSYERVVCHFLIGFSLCLFSELAKFIIAENTFFGIIGADLDLTQSSNYLTN